jgi:hypothetical protein
MKIKLLYLLLLIFTVCAFKFNEKYNVKRTFQLNNKENDLNQNKIMSILYFPSINMANVFFFTNRQCPDNQLMLETNYHETGKYPILGLRLPEFLEFMKFALDSRPIEKNITVAYETKQAKAHYELIMQKTPTRISIIKNSFKYNDNTKRINDTKILILDERELKNVINYSNEIIDYLKMNYNK